MRKNRLIMALPLIVIIAVFIIKQESKGDENTGSNVLNLNSDNFSNEVLDANIPVIVDFYATWCGPCKKLSPVIEELSKEYEGKIKFGKIDVDKNEEIAAQYNIQSIPHLIIFIDGKAQKSVIGLHSKDDLKKYLDNL